MRSDIQTIPGFAAKTVRAACAAGLLSLLVFAGSAPARADFITNGNFETSSGGSSGYGQVGNGVTVNGWSMATTGADGGNAPGYTFLYNTATAASNSFGVALWTTSNGGANTLTASPGGGNFIGQDSAYQNDAIYQLMTGLTSGNSYTLSFYYAAAQQTGFTGATTDSWTAAIGTSIYNGGSTSGYSAYTTTAINDVTKGFSGWYSASYTFTATSTSEYISFLAAGTPSGVPPFALLDDVSVLSASATPEPGTMFLVGSLMVLVAGSMLRARFRKTAPVAVKVSE